MKNKIWNVLVLIVVVAVLASPIVFGIYFLIDPVNAITNVIGAYLWLIIVILPLGAAAFILYGFGLLFFSLFKAIWEVIKHPFQ